jgi:glycosyltransferase involved in cell wall biosynthesis
VPNAGGILARWFRYRDALRTHASDADVVIAFTSVSVGVPLILARLTMPKKVLRLGGEFFWERATDGGSTKSLAEWYRSIFNIWRLLNTLFMEGILRSFDAIVYSTAFQKAIHESVYRSLPPASVIENAVPEDTSVKHRMHDPFRLLFVGRFVHFKNLPVLLETMTKFHDCTLTLTGDGPAKNRLVEYVRAHGLTDRVTFLPPVLGDAKRKLFAEHDLLVIPSVTEISPNVALEARSAGLPVLLTEETGLSAELSKGMLRAPTRDSVHLLSAIMKARSRYDDLAAASPAKRSWSDVTDEWITLLSKV